MTGLDGFWFVLTALAVWRCVVFVRQDTMFEGTRNAVTVRLMRHQSLLATKLLDLIGCPWCLSVWFAAGAVALWELQVDFTLVSAAVTWLALAATAAVLDQIADHL